MLRHFKVFPYVTCVHKAKHGLIFLSFIRANTVFLFIIYLKVTSLRQDYMIYMCLCVCVCVCVWSGSFAGSEYLTENNV